MEVKTPLVVVLGTGGTIAGTGPGPDEVAYRAAQLSVHELLQAVPGLSGVSLETEQVAQIDSKDMDWAVWQSLGRHLRATLARAEVGAVVITHGTDTLEETSYLLHRLLDVSKPVVLTCAMRAATSAQSDGPRNLRHAVRVAERAAQLGQSGVVAVMAGKDLSGRAVRKGHRWHNYAFAGGDDQPLGRIAENGAILDDGPWPPPGGAGWSCLDHAQAPRVEIVTSHASADGRVVEALLAHGTDDADAVKGLVVACTGHGTLHQGLTRSLEGAEARGIKVWRSSRVARGGVPSGEGRGWTAAGGLAGAQARVALMLDVLGVPPAPLAG